MDQIGTGDHLLIKCSKPIKDNEVMDLQEEKKNHMLSSLSSIIFEICDIPQQRKSYGRACLSNNRSKEEAFSSVSFLRNLP